MLQQLEQADKVRLKVVSRITYKRKAELGQFMTPASVARFMAAMFPSSSLHTCRLLDAGAGVGALSCAFLDRWMDGRFDFNSVEVTAYEIDDDLRDHLGHHLAGYNRVKARIISGDYIELATKEGLQCRNYTHAILNPPYKKINSKSLHRQALRQVGIESVNLYSAFLMLVLSEAAPGGQIVAIIPRSFCNGPYYRPFREFVLKNAAIKHLHLFKSRNKAFKDDQVLQENIIVLLERSVQQGPVTISTSTDHTFNDLATHEQPFERIVYPDDLQRFIHVPTSIEKNIIEFSPTICYTLAELGLKVSTGPVVDFRLKEYLHAIPGLGTVPLLYPVHFNSNRTKWPINGMKKPNAIEYNSITQKWLYPNGFYCVVRRFSSKEEKRRIVASVVDPKVFGDVTVLGFENHLNLFHENKHGLPEHLARGLAVFLNSTAVDENFRRFNGHTQVNATDLRLMKYPSRDSLMELGTWAMPYRELTQEMIDSKLGTIIG
jgi:tRNA1(Val) A37 N6-methylase TrmN6